MDQPRLTTIAADDPVVLATAQMEAGTTIVLRPSNAKWLLMLAASVVFTAIGAAMIREGQGAGWFVAGFFGLCALAAVIVLLPGSSYLKIRRDGFVFGTMFRRHHLPWTAVGPFGISQVGMQPMVVFDILDPARLPRAARLNMGVAGANAGLPDTYGMKAGELAAILNAARDRALERAHQAG
ncbi:MAG: hypothetical protein JNL66_19610 [Alphaproteobacteria bacterium]|nr:hypothetical protein [Alphaproteobacteria bacterium]